MFRINIVGAGLAGLTAAVHLAEKGIGCNLISVQISERAQSVMAAGGINAAMDVSGESDTVREHFDDTMRGGVWLAEPEAVRGLTEAAPDIIRRLMALGVPFNMEGDALVQRHFGGQKKIRTAYARSSTGKALMTAMIDAARRYEREEALGTLPEDPEPLIRRFSHHRFCALCISGGRCTGVRIEDVCTGREKALAGPVILAFGGPNGMFPGRTTGTTANDGCALAAVFAQGVELANLEFIQYHPTTVQIPGKCMLISEAARGEGGRLFVLRGGRRWYFMEEKYPELGNLMPRDVISREMDAVARDPACQLPVCLDMTGLPAGVWQKRLPDLRRQVLEYLGIDPATEPVPVTPGIHFFMGGIHVDKDHRTSLPGLFAAGECACQYHGANRLGGNSLLGAIYGGRTAAETAAVCSRDLRNRFSEGQPCEEGPSGRETPGDRPHTEAETETVSAGRACAPVFSAKTAERLAEILSGGLGIVRREDEIDRSLRELKELETETAARADRKISAAPEQARFLLGEAMLLSARARRESRGAHCRSDYPERNDAEYRKKTVAVFKDGEIRISFREIPGLDEGEETGSDGKNVR